MIVEKSRREQKLVYVLCDFTYDDGVTEEIEVNLFNPQSEEKIQEGVNNRYITENRNHQPNI